MAIAVPAHVPAQRKRGWFATLIGAESKLQVPEAVWGYILSLPWIIGLVVFLVGPIIASAYFSLTEYDVLSPPKWVGLANYQQAFLKTANFGLRWGAH